MIRIVAAVAIFCAGLFIAAQAQDTCIGCGVTGMFKPSGGGTITLQHHGGAANSAGGNTNTQTLSTVAANNIIVVGIAYCHITSCDTNESTTISSVASSNAGETCTNVTGSTSASTNGTTTSVYWCLEKSTSDSITVTTSSSANTYYLSVSLSEWSGMAASPIDGTLANSATGGSSSTTCSLTTNGNTTQSSEMVYANNLPPSGTTAGQTVINTINSKPADEYQISGAPGSTYTNTFSWGTGHTYACSLAVFKHS